MWVEDIARLADRSFASVENVQAINRQNDFEPQVRFVSHNNRVAPAFFANDEPTIADDQSWEKTTALILESDRDQTFRRRGKHRPTATPCDCSNHRANSGGVVVV